jgi:hypothetical protein
MSISKKMAMLFAVLAVTVGCTTKSDNMLEGAWKCDSTIVTFMPDGKVEFRSPNGVVFNDTYSVDKYRNISWGRPDNPYAKLSTIAAISFKDLLMTGAFDLKSCTR